MRSSKIGLGLLLAGISALIGMRVVNDRDDWIVVSADLPVTASKTLTQNFTAQTDGYAEIQIEVDATVDSDLRDTYIFPTNEPSALDVHWEVQDESGVIAAGDARDYLYVEGIPSLLGRVRRNIMQVPFGRTAAHWNSLGITGSRTIARGIGKFSMTAGAQYSITVTARGDYPDLIPSAPTVAVRVDRRAWQSHYESVRVLGYLGLALIAAGLTISVSGRLRPASLSPTP